MSFAKGVIGDNKLIVIHVYEIGLLWKQLLVKHSQIEKLKRIHRHYINYLRKHFGSNVTVVFDSYNNQQAIEQHPRSTKTDTCT